ncbi:MAG: hypothetical protein ACI4ML_11885, partial [Aristaeellaceae bacterium]
ARAETMTFSDMTIPAFLVSVEIAEDGYGMTLKLTMTPTAAAADSVARWSIYGNGEHWGSLMPSGYLQFSGWVESFDRSGTLMLTPVYASAGEASNQALILSLPMEDDGLEPNYGRMAQVLCESLSLRQSPSFSAQVITTLGWNTTLLPEGDPVDGWQLVTVVADDGSLGYTGYVRSEYLLYDCRWYTAAASTPVYAYPSPEAPRVGLLDKDSAYPIIAEYNGYIVISLRGASGFVLP